MPRILYVMMLSRSPPASQVTAMLVRANAVVASGRGRTPQEARASLKATLRRQEDEPHGRIKLLLADLVNATRN
jgi:hypothetical protein